MLAKHINDTWYLNSTPSTPQFDFALFTSNSVVADLYLLTVSIKILTW